MEIIGALWTEIIMRPMINSLSLLYDLLFNNFGLSIIVFTVAVRLAMIPLTVRQTKQMRAMSGLQPKIKALQAKFANRRFTAIGVNLDHDKDALTSYLRSHPLSWPQLYESGGLDSRLASELGIVTLPAMIMVDRSGRVARRNIHAAELEAEIERLAK